VSEPLVRFEGVHKRFGSKVVLNDHNLEVMRGETLVILGRSGIGKSVALKLLLGLLKPDKGSVWFDGVDVAKLDEQHLLDIRKRIGMVFQGGALFDSLTVEDNVSYALLEHQKLPPAKVRARVKECLALVDLKDVEGLLPDALSGGMRKRVAIARAIAPAPELLLYDEPTTGLDPATAKHVNELIRGLKTRLGVTSMVVTHDMDSAFAIADRIALLGDGHVVWIGSVEEARENPPSQLIEFLGQEPQTWTPPGASP
jgi:phospholipid/cholesterol/gamma-HCH transport system ATP-binding protein